MDTYKAKYTKIRDRAERVIIDGICNSACTLVLGIVPLNRICVTPKASLGFHQAYYDQAWTFGMKVMRLAAADRGAANARIASHLRRLQTASTPSKPFRVSSAIGEPYGTRTMSPFRR